MTASKPTTWMPIYWGDYWGETHHLSAAEHGAYLNLIGHYWVTQKPIPDNDAMLARIARMTTAEWTDARAILLPFFIACDGQWQHERIEREMARSQEMINKRSEAGKAGATARWAASDGNDNAPAMAKPLANACDPQWQNDGPSPSPSEAKASEGADAPPRQSKAVDIGVWEFDDKAKAIALAEHLDPKEIQASVWDWAANATAAARRKKDPHAFLRKWCRTEATRWKGPAFLDRNAGADPVEREYLAGTTIPMGQAKSYAKLIADNAKSGRGSITENTVRALLAEQLVTAEEVQRWRGAA